MPLVRYFAEAFLVVGLESLQQHVVYEAGRCLVLLRTVGGTVLAKGEGLIGPVGSLPSLRASSVIFAGIRT